VSGDPRTSLADISRARELIGYSPKYTVEDGLKITVDWSRKG
jgi:UDP-N-acetylglucosamine 4-epimerase